MEMESSQSKDSVFIRICIKNVSAIIGKRFVYPQLEHCTFNIT
jgi:hypothetical protein